MNLELRKFSIENLSEICRLFNNEEFFFETKRPNTLNNGNIKNIICENKENFFLILINNSIKGILYYKEDPAEKGSVFLCFRCNDMNMLIDNVELFKIKLKSILSNFKVIKIKVFDFDELGKKICKQMSFSPEAIFKKHIFKYNAYHDLIIYSKLNKVGDYHA